jgi:hypothetical protein
MLSFQFEMVSETFHINCTNQDYDDVRLMIMWVCVCVQQAAGNFYDLTAYSGVPSTIATGRDQTGGLASAPFSGNFRRVFFSPL